MAKRDRSSPDPPAAKFLADHPAKLTSSDAFGHLDYARAIASTLAEAPIPFTLGLFGRWGIGKSSIIDAVQTEAKEVGLAFATFDVWRYEGDALRRQFLKDIAWQLKTSGSLERSYDPEEELRDLDVDLAVPEEQLKFSKRNLFVAGLVALVTGFIVFAFLYLRAESHLGLTVSKREITGDALLSLIVATLAFAAALVNRVFRVDQRVVSLRRIEEPERFLKKFSELLDAVKAHRLVVAVDNLDRCSPALADQMLATIKTYLEPATPADGNQTNVVFLIAVDDAALRRHLVARELEATIAGHSARDTRTADSAALQAAEGYVSEYLRKFFTATLRIKTLLDEEMRMYVAGELEQLVEAYELKSQAEQLTTMVASALRQNPRQVKQFANNLEARLRLIREREQSGRILKRLEAPISREVIAVAKLALIEEQWPDRYKRIERDPRLLSEWHGAVIAGSEMDNEDRPFAAFLRTTQDVAIPDIYPLLRLRQTSAERDLPEYGRFREAITLGAIPEAAEIIEQAEESKRGEYTQRLVDIFDEEVDRGGIQGARNVLDATLGGAALDVPDATARTLVVRALQVQTLRDELWRLDPKSVLAFRTTLGSRDRQLLLQPFLRLDAIVKSAPDRMAPTAEALAGTLEELSSAELETIRSALQADSVAPRYSDYLPLARSQPDLLSDQHVQAAYAEWSSRSPTQLDGAPIEIMALGLAAGRAPEIADTFVGQIPNLLATASSAPDLLTSTLNAAIQLVEPIPVLSDSAVQQTLGALQGQFPDLVAAAPLTRSPLVHLAGALADRSVDKSDSTINLATWFLERLFEDPAMALDYLEKSGQHVPQPLRPPALAQLAQLVQTSTDPSLRLRGGRLLAATNETGPQSLQTALNDLVSRGEFEASAGLMLEFSDSLPTLTEAVDSYLSVMGNVAVDGRESAARGLRRIADLLRDEQLERSKDLLEEMLLSTHEEPIREAIGAAEALSATHRFDNAYRDLIRSAARKLSASDHDPDEIELLRWACANGERLDAVERGALLAQTRRWLGDNVGGPDDIAAAAASLPGLNNDQQVGLVQSILEAEAIQSDASVRTNLLLAADVAKSRTRRGAGLLKERLSTLRSSGDESDRAVIADFDARRGEA